MPFPKFYIRHGGPHVKGPSVDIEKAVCLHAGHRRLTDQLADWPEERLVDKAAN